MLLTLFGTPKPFVGRFDTLQKNAIESWTRLGPECEVLLLGDEEGTAAAAAELGVRHVPEVPSRPSGVPLLSGLLDAGRAHGTGDVLCYVNADIVLTSDLVDAVRAVRAAHERFLLTGRRITLEVPERLDFHGDWADALTRRARADGQLDPPNALDYFAFSRNVLRQVAPFAIGRTVWDNWLLYAARRDGAALIDASARVTAIHQAHDYSSTADDVWYGPDAQHNQALAGGPHHMFTLDDATHVLDAAGLRPARDPRRLWRRALTQPMLELGWELPLRLVLRATYVALKLRGGISRPSAP